MPVAEALEARATRTLGIALWAVPAIGAVGAKLAGPVTFADRSAADALNCYWVTAAMAVAGATIDTRALLQALGAKVAIAALGAVVARPVPNDVVAEAGAGSVAFTGAMTTARSG